MISFVFLTKSSEALVVAKRNQSRVGISFACVFKESNRLSVVCKAFCQKLKTQLSFNYSLYRKRTCFFSTYISLIQNPSVEGLGTCLTYSAF